MTINISDILPLPFIDDGCYYCQKVLEYIKKHGVKDYKIILTPYINSVGVMEHWHISIIRKDGEKVDIFEKGVNA